MAEQNATWDEFALLLIDVQQDFWPDEIAIAHPQFESRVESLLALSREQGIDIVHLRAKFSADRSDWMRRYRLSGRIPCIEGTPGAHVLPAALEQTGETVFHKQTFDGFENPQLEPYLKQHGKRFLLVAGLVTSVCVLLTSATAAQRGYLVSLVEDCCADDPQAHAHTMQHYPFIFDRTAVAQIPADRDRWLAELRRCGD